jgi:methyl-accepting chemotaxis protein
MAFFQKTYRFRFWLDVLMAFIFGGVVWLYAVAHRDDLVLDEVLCVLILLVLLVFHRHLQNKILSPLTQLAECAHKIAENKEVEIAAYQFDLFKDISLGLRYLLQSIQQATAFVREVAKGNLQADYTFQQGNQGNALGEALVKMRDEMVRIAAEELQRKWATEGLAHFADILRNNNDDVRLLSKEILEALIQYLNANQGGVFLLKQRDEKGAELEMLACYAYNRQKFLKKSIYVENDYAQGLVGQVFLEKTPLYLTDIPQDYLKITSGLGNASPQFLFIVPLLMNEQIFGVMELASFTAIEPYQRDFIEKVSENITITIASVCNNQQTKELLEATQIQAEQLKAQEEEMRQNMEELATTQEEMQRKQLLLETQNQKMQANETILQKALKKAQEVQKELKEKSEQIATQEEEMRQNMEELITTQEEMHRRQVELEATNEKMYANEEVLKKFAQKAKETEKKLKDEVQAKEKEITELKKQLEIQNNHTQ